MLRLLTAFKKDSGLPDVVADALALHPSLLTQKRVSS